MPPLILRRISVCASNYRVPLPAMFTVSTVCSIQGCDPGLASDTLITGHRDRDSPDQSRAQEAGSFYFDKRFNKVEAVELDMEQAGGGGRKAVMYRLITGAGLVTG